MVDDMTAQPVELAGFVWCIAGVHINESLDEIVARKQRDIQRYGWCLWAYGGAGNAHPDLQVRRLAADLGGADDYLTVLMPTSGIDSPPGAAFDGYREAPSGSITVLPDGMSPVTGGARSWAFVLSSLEVRQVSVDLAAYEAPYANKGPTPLPSTFAAPTDGPLRGGLMNRWDRPLFVLLIWLRRRRRPSPSTSCGADAVADRHLQERKRRTVR
jgi:hypothetical protein